MAKTACTCIACHCSSGLGMGRIARHTEIAMVGNGCDGWQVGRGSGEVEIVCHGESGDTTTVAVYSISP